MSTFDDDLRERENQAEPSFSYTPDTEEAKLLEPHEKALVEFDPSKRKNPKSADDFSYRPGDPLEGAGLGGKALSLAGRSGAFANKHKGAVGGVGGGIGLLIALGLIGSSMMLPGLKNNAARQLGGVSSSVLDSYGGTLLGRVVKNVGRDTQRIIKINQSADELGEILKGKGYEFLDDGTLKLPGGEILEGNKLIQNELKAAARDEVGANWRNRSKVAKSVRKKAVIPTTSPTDAADALEGEDEARAGPDADDAIKRAREDVIEGQNPDDGFEQGRDAVEALQEEADDAAKQTQEEILEDSTKQSDDALVDVAEEGLESSAAAGAAAEAGGAGIISKLGLGAFITTEVCGTGKKVQAANTLGLLAKKVNLLRLGGVIVNMADAQITGREDPELKNKLLNTIQKSPTTGKSMQSSAGLSFITGSGAQKPTTGELAVFGTGRQKVNGFLGVLMDIYSVGYVRRTCDVATTNEGQIALAAAEFGATAVSLGGVSVTTQALKEALKEGFKTAIPQVAASVGFYFAGQFAADYVSKAALGMIFDFGPNKGGPFAGNAIGSALGVKQEVRDRNSGMAPVTASTYLNLMKDVREEQKTELASKSLFERFVKVGPTNTQSLASRVLIGSPIAANNIGTMAQNLAMAFTGGELLNQTQQFASTALSGSAFAQDGNTYTDENGFVTDPWGNYILGNNFEDIDPVDNINALLESGDIDQDGNPVEGGRVSQYLEKCGQIDIHEESSNKVLAECTTATAASRSIQAYLASWDNIEGFSARLHPEVAEPESAPGASTETGSVDPTEDTSGIACAAGTEEGGNFQDYGERKTIGARIKICGVPGAINKLQGVNSSISGKVAELFAAARNEGLSLSGGSFRSYDSQVELRKQHCGTSEYAVYQMPSGECSPPTARPGGSMHELGLAIDFDNCSSSSGCFRWLKSNAAKYGLYNLPSESWHWSINGN